MRIGPLRSKRIGRFLLRIARERAGSSGVEYGFILAVIVLIVFAAIVQMGDVTQRMWSNINSRVASASQ